MSIDEAERRSLFILFLASSSAPPSLLQCSAHKPLAPRPGTTPKLLGVEPPIETAVVVAGLGEGTDLREGVEILASGRGETTKQASTRGAGIGIRRSPDEMVDGME